MLNVQRTIRQLIAAGCKGCFLEDQAWPKRMGHMRNKEVIEMEEFAAKVGTGGGRAEGPKVGLGAGVKVGLGAGAGAAVLWGGGGLGGRVPRGALRPLKFAAKAGRKLGCGACSGCTCAGWCTVRAAGEGGMGREEGEVEVEGTSP